MLLKNAKRFYLKTSSRGILDTGSKGTRAASVRVIIQRRDACKQSTINESKNKIATRDTSNKSHTCHNKKPHKV